MYPTPNITRPYQLLQYISSTNHEIFGTGILAAIFIIMFITMNKYSSEKALLASAWTVTILSMLFRVLDLVGTQVVVACVVITIASMIFNYVSNRA